MEARRCGARSPAPVLADLVALARQMEAGQWPETVTNGHEVTRVAGGVRPADGAPDDRLLLTYQDAARVLSSSVRSVRRRVGEGSLPSVRLGRSVRIPREALTALTKEKPCTP